jgi:hypothetical protein
MLKIFLALMLSLPCRGLTSVRNSVHIELGSAMMADDGLGGVFSLRGCNLDVYLREFGIGLLIYYLRMNV